MTQPIQIIPTAVASPSGSRMAANFYAISAKAHLLTARMQTPRHRASYQHRAAMARRMVGVCLRRAREMEAGSVGQ